MEGNEITNVRVNTHTSMEDEALLSILNISDSAVISCAYEQEAPLVHRAPYLHGSCCRRERRSEKEKREISHRFQTADIRHLGQREKGSLQDNSPAPFHQERTALMEFLNGIVILHCHCY